MDTCFSKLKEAKQRFDKKIQISSPKIQRVPEHLRQNKRFYKYCVPEIISFGPIHHNSESVTQGEDYKLLWTSKFVEKYGEYIGQDTNQAHRLLFKRIEDNIEVLKNLFSEDVIEEGFNDNDLACMLFVDGCSLIHFMDNIDDNCPEKLNVKFGQMMLIWRDAKLLENQLPTKLIEILCKDWGPNVEFLYGNYHSFGERKRLGNEVMFSSEYHHTPFHILDSARAMYIPSILPEEENEMKEISGEHKWYTNKTIRDLTAVGIRVVKNKTCEWNWDSISFTSKTFSGELRLPFLLFNDGTPYFFRNLMAFEMCPDVPCKYEGCSFISFMDSLIDNADDVKELRLAGVFRNLLRSDEELAKLFNELGKDLPIKMYVNHHYTNAVAYSKKYIDIKLQIEKHYTNKWKTSLARVYHSFQ